MMFFAKLEGISIDTRGGSAVEFALVLPLLIFLLLGTIDGGRLMWTFNRAEKATQVGARYAVVSDMIPNGLYTTDYSATLGQGASVAGAFGIVRCTKPAASVSCSCFQTPCPTLTPIKSAVFDAIVQRMHNIAPDINAPNVRVDYADSGLGYAGDPNGSDVAPLVTVTAVNTTFTPLLFQFFGTSFTLPNISATLTLEDGSSA